MKVRLSLSIYLRNTCWSLVHRRGSNKQTDDWLFMVGGTDTLCWASTSNSSIDLILDVHEIRIFRLFYSERTQYFKYSWAVRDNFFGKNDFKFVFISDSQKRG